MTNWPSISTSRIFLQSQQICKEHHSTPVLSDRIPWHTFQLNITLPSQGHWLQRVQKQHPRHQQKLHFLEEPTMTQGLPRHLLEYRRSIKQNFLPPLQLVFLMENKRNILESLFHEYHLEMEKYCKRWKRSSYQICTRRIDCWKDGSCKGLFARK